MTNYFAISTEKGKTNGNVIGNTKQGTCKGMSKEEFTAYMKNNTWQSFEVKEMKVDYSEHRKYLNDKWVSAS